MSDKSISPREAAATLGVRQEWLYDLLRRGRIQASKTPTGHWRISLAAVLERQRWMEMRDAELEAIRA